MMDAKPSIPDTPKRTPLASLDVVVLDTETTGLDPARSRVIQIGAVSVCHGAVRLDQRYDVLVNPGIPIPPATTKIHRLNDGNVADAQSFAELAPQLSAYLGRRVLVGHHVDFDASILEHEYSRTDAVWQRPATLDTVAMAQLANPLLSQYDLDTVAAWLGVTIEGRHSAIGDAVATAHVFAALLPRLQQRDIRTLSELERACRTVADSSHGGGSDWLAPGRIPAEDGKPRAPLSRIDSFAYRHRVSEIMASPAIFVSEDATLKETADLLVAKGISSVFVRAKGAKDAAGKTALGIVTERDLMRALSASPESYGIPVSAIMSHPLGTIGEEAFVYQAISRMARDNYRHLAVADPSGNIAGALSSGDMLRERSRDALVLGGEIDQAGSAAELGAIWARLPEVARAMLDDGVGVLRIAAVIAEELCALTRRVAELTETAMAEDGEGAPPVPYSLLVLGSGGRGESLLMPDQDNALILESGDPGGPEDQWFERFGRRVNQTLDDIGIPLCNGGVMAGQAKWRYDLRGWEDRVRGWIARSVPGDMFYVDNFFDYRPVHGKVELAQELWRFAYGAAGKSPSFLKELAAIATNIRAPIGMMGRLISVQGRVGLKKHGLLAFVSGARLLALRHGVEKRSTVERLRGIRDLEEVNDENVDDVILAQAVLMREILLQQLDDIDAGLQPSNRVDLARLSKHRRGELKWALAQVEVMHSMVGDPVAPFG